MTNRKPHTRNKREPKLCKFCSSVHSFERGICPALGKVCSKCGKKNHFRSYCKVLHIPTVSTIFKLSKEHHMEDGAYAWLLECAIKIKFLLDFRANVNFIQGPMVPAASLLKYNSYEEVLGGGKITTVCLACFPLSLNGDEEFNIQL
ncbi:unnamed protein product [Lepeophtheirus salmonis]|uniref:(salmon louse) hypothetical protein n=1 Tax=Lepeophtheirus salmonis TaxID=72036 RepID=A0A7R8CJX9_LEPSM|nr:unnamed protein product [Lepeophtheirus salmonis]CAF2842282.1 unnamed protein product [Lepeophtheirus salmonis]